MFCQRLSLDLLAWDSCFVRFESPFSQLLSLDLLASVFCFAYLCALLWFFSETSVDVKRYLEHRRESYRNLVGIDMSVQREGQEIRVFEEIDSDHSGTIEWWEYARSTCMRLLSRRKQVLL